MKLFNAVLNSTIIIVTLTMSNGDRAIEALSAHNPIIFKILSIIV